MTTPTATKVKTIVLTSTGSGSDYSNLQIKEEDYPKIEDVDQVIVRIKAAGLNFAELMQRQGLYRPSTKTPYTPGYEGAGIVEEVGNGVNGEFAKNDRVIVFNSSGIWKEVVCLPKSQLVKMPDNMSFEDAAGLIVNYITAYQILFRLANIQPGDHVLIHMAGGGVGIAAIQLCRTVPNITIYGTASASKHEALKEIGVDYPIDYTKHDYIEQIKKISPDGVDVVLDPLNGENAIKGYDILRPLGRIVHYGAASMTTENRSLLSAFKTWWKCLSINSLDILSDNKSVSGYHLGYLMNNKSFAKKTIKDIETLLKLYQEEKIKIKVDSVWSYSKVGEAMKRMHDRKNLGKIILKPDVELVETSTTEQQAPVLVVEHVIVEPKNPTTPTTTKNTKKKEKKEAPVVPVLNKVETEDNNQEAPTQEIKEA